MRIYQGKVRNELNELEGFLKMQSKRLSVPKLPNSEVSVDENTFKSRYQRKKERRYKEDRANSIEQTHNVQ